MSEMGAGILRGPDCRRDNPSAHQASRSQGAGSTQALQGAETMGAAKGLPATRTPKLGLRGTAGTGETSGSAGLGRTWWSTEKPEQKGFQAESRAQGTRAHPSAAQELPFYYVPTCVS